MINLVTTAMVYAPGISPVYHGMLSIPNVTLSSIMACRVYRNAKLHRPIGVGMSLPVITDAAFTVPLSMRSSHSRPRIGGDGETSSYLGIPQPAGDKFIETTDSVPDSGVHHI